MQRYSRFWFQAAVFCAAANAGLAQSGRPVAFNAPREFPGGTAGVVTADFNGDGSLDLATIDNYNSYDLVILLGNGQGAFQTGATYTFPFAERPNAVAAADFNRDGKLDLVVVSGPRVAILLGNGDGTFQAPLDFFAGGSAFYVTVGDFNNDAIPDLAVVNYFYNTVSILTGKGDGTFGPPVLFNVGFAPVFAVTGDFNGDGNLDLAVANSGYSSHEPGSISILLGTGTGDFQPAVNYGRGSPSVLLVGDFNGDGKPDLAAARFYGDAISILLGNGDGTFATGAEYKLPSQPGWLGLGDFNGDGKPDIAVDTGDVLLGNGDGTFHRSSHTFQPTGPFAVADYNGDGKLDLAACNGSGIGVLLGSGHASFQQAVTFAVPGGAVFLASADFNGDGHPDLAVPNQTNVSILLGNGQGGFQVAGMYAAGSYPAAAAVADFNGDGKSDLAVLNYNRSTGGFSILLGNGDGTFQAPISYQTGDFPASVLVADFNGDGKPDLLVNEGYDNFLAIFLGKGDGTFRRAPNYSLTNLGYVVTGDFDGDGKWDIAVLNAPVNQPYALTILLSNGDGTFHTGATYNNVSSATYVFAGDLNGDHKLDLLLPGVSTTLTMLGNGDGTFQSPSTMNFASGLSVLADFNGDGKLDLATLGNLGVGFALGNGDGTFQMPVYFDVGSVVQSLLAGDFNGDGKPDVTVPNGSIISILTNWTR